MVWLLLLWGVEVDKIGPFRSTRVLYVVWSNGGQRKVKNGVEGRRGLMETTHLRVLRCSWWIPGGLPFVPPRMGHANTMLPRELPLAPSTLSCLMLMKKLSKMLWPTSDQSLLPLMPPSPPSSCTSQVRAVTLEIFTAFSACKAPEIGWDWASSWV